MFPRLVRRAVIVALVGSIALVVPATAAHAAVSCEVTYRTTSWSTGFAATVQLDNLGDTWDGYAFTFDFRGEETVTAAWRHSYVQSGKTVTFRPDEAARPVPTGGTARLGFLGRHTGTTSPPANLRVDDVYCAVSGPPHVIIEPDVVPYGEGGVPTGFTMRLSGPPRGSGLAMISAVGSGPTYTVQPIAYFFNAQNWNIPQTYRIFPTSDDFNTVDDRTVITVSVEGFAPDTVVLQQRDRG